MTNPSYPNYQRLLQNRDDVFFKLPFARSLIGNYRDSDAKNMYINSLYHFNNFFEDKPSKNSSHDFIQSFEELAKSVLNFDSNQRFEREVEVDVRGHLLNGSHRIAAEIAFNQINRTSRGLNRFEVSSTNLATNWDLNYFASIGIGSAYLNRATLERISFFRGRYSPLLIIWPAAEEYTSSILSFLHTREIKIRSLHKLIVDPTLLAKVVGPSYSEATWSQSRESIDAKLKDTGTHGTISIILLEESNLQSMSLIKDELRNIWNNSIKGIHITDDWWESFSLFSTLTSPSSIKFLYTLSDEDFFGSLHKFSRMSRQINDEINSPLSFARPLTIRIFLATLMRHENVTTMGRYSFTVPCYP